jgi:hypothetical protein
MQENNTLNTITRTELIEGFSVPAIILNGKYFLIDLQVYKDGLVNCWEMVDLELFKQKLSQKWVVTTIPDNSYIAVHNLGNWRINESSWNFTPQTFYEYVFNLVKQLNPRLENLYNCFGKTTETISNVEVSKFGIPQTDSYYISFPHPVIPRKTFGKYINVLFRDEDKRIYLTELSIFKDGNITLSNLPHSKSFKLEDLHSLIKEKKIFSELPIGERVIINKLGSFVITEGDSNEINDIHAEIIEHYNMLNGKESIINKCRRLFELYMIKPNQELKEELKVTYEAIPNHLKSYVGDMDSGDSKIRHILYGEEDY